MKYGPTVRIGPTTLDLDIPELVKTIYTTKEDWKKTAFYHASSSKRDGKILYNLFSETDVEKHARDRRPIAKYFSLNAMNALEPAIDKVVNRFCQRLEEEFMIGPNAGGPCDFGRWIEYCAWDLVGQATYGQELGYLAHGSDFDGLISINRKTVTYFGIVGQIPILDYFFAKNPIYRMGPPAFDGAVQKSAQYLFNRYKDNAKAGEQEVEKGQSLSHGKRDPDFLDKYIEAKQQHPDVVDDAQILSYQLINVIAGADTTSNALSAILYHALKNPRVWSRLEAEILAAANEKESHEDNAPSAITILPFKTTHTHLPYLSAVIREGMRMHPAVGMPLERHVPASLSSPFHLPSDPHVLPAGTTVGLSPYIIARNRAVFGEDADVFRPERWLHEGGESKAEFDERLRKMNAADLTFGAGSRICIGRFVAALEIEKVISEVVRRYRVRLVEDEEEEGEETGEGWKVVNNFFMYVEGFVVKLEKR